MTSRDDSPTTPDSPTPAIAEVKAASAAWIAGFNAGDVDRCVAGYQPDAVMVVTPTGTFTGTEAIDGFWRPFMGSGAKDLVYTDVELKHIDDGTVTLAASWSMNVGRGIITEERWVRQDDGTWLLAYDAFEIQEQF